MEVLIIKWNARGGERGGEREGQGEPKGKGEEGKEGEGITEVERDEGEGGREEKSGRDIVKTLKKINK